MRMAELDPTSSVRVMLYKEPAFFASEPFQRCTENGEFLSLDYDYFAEYIEDSILSLSSSRDQRRNRYDDERAEALVRVLEDYVGEESLQKLCDHFLPFLDDETLFNMLLDVRDYHAHKSTPTEPPITEALDERELQVRLARLVLIECRWKTLDDAIFMNALALYSTRMVKYLTSIGDEGEEVGEAILADLEKHGLTLSSREEKLHDSDCHWSLRRSLLFTNAREEDDRELRRLRCRFVCFEAFLLRFRVIMDFTDERSLRKIMKYEGIPFRPVYMTTEKKRKRSKKSKKSKIKYKKELVGWRFLDGVEDKREEGTNAENRHLKRKRTETDSGLNEDDASGSGLTYGVADTPGYIIARFTDSILRWFASHAPGKRDQR